MRFKKPSLSAMINTAVKGENLYSFAENYIGGKPVGQLIDS